MVHKRNCVASAACLMFFLGTSIGQAAAQSCTLRTANPSVTVCTPTANGIAPISPVQVVAGTTDSYTVTAVQIYVDSVLVYQVNANAVNTYIPLATGNHLITVQGWDALGRTFKTNVPSP